MLKKRIMTYHKTFRKWRHKWSLLWMCVWEVRKNVFTTRSAFQRLLRKAICQQLPDSLKLELKFISVSLKVIWLVSVPGYTNQAPPLLILTVWSTQSFASYRCCSAKVTHLPGSRCMQCKHSAWFESSSQVLLWHTSEVHSLLRQGHCLTYLGYAEQRYLSVIALLHRWLGGWQW